MATTDHDKLAQRFGKQLALQRKRQGLTQAQLAEQVGMSVVSIAYLETGKRWARLATLRMLAEALDCTIADFFTGV